MKPVEIKIRENAIHCEGCQSRIQNVIGRMEGVSSVKADRQTQKVLVTLEGETTTYDEIVSRLERLGYPVDVEKS